MMRIRPLSLLLVLAVLPVIVMTLAARRLATQESDAVRRRFEKVLQGRLADADAGIAVHFDRVAARLRRLTAIDDYDVAALRAVIRNEPALLQLFVLSPDGKLQYPHPADSLNETEQSFLLRTATMFTGRDIQSAVMLARKQMEGAAPKSTPPDDVDDVETGNGISAGMADDQGSGTERSPLSSASDAMTSGWFVWYWERGLNLIFWQTRPSGHVVGAALERARWMADLVAVLPETRSSEPSASGETTLIRLVNSASVPVYQWGNQNALDGTGDGEAEVKPLCEIPVSSPLASWRLQCFVTDSLPQTGMGLSAYVGLAGGLLAVGLTIVSCAVLLWKDYTRDMRRAEQQVSFVNQVSHELKTPLTNIRLYAELLERDLDDVEESVAARSRKRLEVILGEGQRLGRLIANVLTFARQQRKTLDPQLTEVVVDDLLRQVVDRFRPGLEPLQMELILESGAAAPVRIDPDFLEQIVGNLISNVEKYAAGGGLLRIRSRLDGDHLVIDVTDAGPGIPRKDRQRVFQPFMRGANDVRSAAGTGIGLSIARELARLHGGDLTLVSAEQGCVFRVVLRTGN